MKVLSLFDGISCGRVAFERAGIPVEVYVASEVDKYAIQVSKKNYPDILHIGDVNKIDFNRLKGVDIIIGGSPCQDLSIAKQNRQGLKGERSGLFWKYVEALEIIRPKCFLLENVASMKNEDRDAITDTLRKIYPNVYCTMINSALVSAQQRKRYYWTNWKVEQPENKGILLKDVLESGVALSGKSRAIISSIGRTTEREFFKKAQGTMVAEPIRPNRIGGFYGQVTRWGIYDENATAPTLTASMGMGGGFVPMIPERIGQIEGLGKGQANRIYSVHGKSVCLNALGGGGGAKTGLYKIDLPDGDYTIRKLTPVECEHLQTLPGNYTAGVSNTQRYKMLGNGWTVDVIAHILKQIPEENND